LGFIGKRMRNLLDFEDVPLADSVLLLAQSLGHVKSCTSDTSEQGVLSSSCAEQLLNSANLPNRPNPQIPNLINHLTTTT
jgi:hypothetical protein